MIAHRPDQQNLFGADTQYLDFVGSDNFYGFLARHGRQLFCDEDFPQLYCPDFRRPSVPPSLLAIALLLQAHDKVSDAEATEQAAFDMCRKVALGVEIDERPFAKSTLQLFRMQLLIHDQARAIFTRSLEFARQTGYLKGRTARLAVDSTHIFGRGAVEDTYKLIVHGIRKLCRMLAQAADEEPARERIEEAQQIFYRYMQTLERFAMESGLPRDMVEHFVSRIRRRIKRR